MLHDDWHPTLLPVESHSIWVGLQITSYSGYFGHIFSQWNEVETSLLSFGLVNAHTQSYFFTFFTSFLCKPHTLYVMFYDNICSLLVNFYLPAVDSPCHTTSMLDVHLGYSLHTLSFIYPLVRLWSPSIHWNNKPLMCLMSSPFSGKGVQHQDSTHFYSWLYWVPTSFLLMLGEGKVNN